MKHRVFRLVRDIQNPHHNRRRKYGLEAVEVFKAGSLVRASDVQPKQGEPYTSYQFGLDWNYVNGSELEEEFAKQDPGVEVPIQTLEEAAAASFTNIDNFCREVVIKLIKEGRLDPAETKELYEKTDP